MNARKLLITIGSILFACLIPVYMLSSSFGAEAFADATGRALTIGICVSFALAAFSKVIASHTAPEFSAKVGRVFRFFLGIGFILWGCWAFGEKSRFAAQPVTRTEAVITHVDDAFLGRGTIELSYTYQDAEGRWHKGGDNVDNWIPYNFWLDAFLNKGGKIPINYLNASPNVSRLVEQHYILVYSFKIFLILVGISIIKGSGSGTFRWKKSRTFYFRWGKR